MKQLFLIFFLFPVISSYAGPTGTSGKTASGLVKLSFDGYLKEAEQCRKNRDFACVVMQYLNILEAMPPGTDLYTIEFYVEKINAILLGKQTFNFHFLKTSLSKLLGILSIRHNFLYMQTQMRIDEIKDIPHDDSNPELRPATDFESLYKELKYLINNLADSKVMINGISVYFRLFRIFVLTLILEELPKNSSIITSDEWPFYRACGKLIGNELSAILEMQKLYMNNKPTKAAKKLFPIFEYYYVLYNHTGGTAQKLTPDNIAELNAIKAKLGI